MNSIDAFNYSCVECGKVLKGKDLELSPYLCEKCMTIWNKRFNGWIENGIDFRKTEEKRILN